ncbi:HAMP domain-containing sensor histidine kinase [Eubacteriaceae bacterium ES2]|nr:HAMP domain-containing sensor histidine kinase [Eubacteriaceae bacterium ES2]
MMKRHFARIKIQTKLTLWYAVLTVLLLMILMPLIYFPFKQSLMANEENLLKLQASQADIDMESSIADSFGIQINTSFKLGTYLSIFDKNNQLIIAEANIPDDLLDLKSSMNEIRIINTNEGDYLILDQVIDDDNVDQIWIRAVRSLVAYNQTLEDFRERLLWGIPIYLIVAFLGGAFMTRSALRPLTRMANTARKIGQGQLDKRMEMALPDDEMGLLAKTFNEMLNELESSFKKEKQFTSDASHELKTPIAVISAHTENALLFVKEEGALTDSLKVIEKETKAMNRIVAQLLMLTRSDQTNAHIIFENLNLSYLVEDCLSIYLENEAAVNYRITGIIEDSVYMTGDQTLLTRLFVNLIDNSIKYGQKGNVIDLELKQTAEQICFTIADHGRGISKEDLPYIFEPFYRADEARAQDGSGLGLALVKKIVLLHHGSVEVNSEMNKGTTFVIIFPKNKV